MKYKLRFVSDDERMKVFAQSKADGTWHQIGICHPAAVKDIKAGKMELINFNAGIPYSKVLIAGQ